MAKNLYGFITNSPYWEMAPSNNLVSTGYALAKPGAEYVVYLPSGGPVTVNLSAVSGNGTGQWYNPRTGQYLAEFQFSGGGSRSFTAPDTNDWVLRLRGSGATNTPPSASDLNVSTNQDTPLSITLPYADPDGPGPYTFTIVQGPTNGFLSGTGATRTYTPTAGYTGPDSFTWKVNDGLADSNVAIVNITVTAPVSNVAPTAFDKSVTTTAGTQVYARLDMNDPDGPGPFTYTIVTGPVMGTLTGSSNDRWYTPNSGFTGTDSFTWKVNDGLADSNIATVTIEVTSSSTLILALNAGGVAAGSYGADANFSGGSIYSNSNAIDAMLVTNPAPESVYQSVRYGNFSYALPSLTPGASYTVRLHFAEIYWTSAGSRLFNVSINGSQVLSNFDILADAGGAYKADVKQFTATADSSGKITIQFTTVNDNATVSGIEVLTVAGLRASDGVGSESNAALTRNQLGRISQEAIHRWAAAGADPSALGKVKFYITNLPGNLLAQTSGNVIWVDVNAAGHGWFVDPTPRDDVEYLAGTVPAGIDLLSAVSHELGHVLGLDHGTGVMSDTLAEGVRIVPTTLDLAGVVWDWPLDHSARHGKAESWATKGR